MLASSAVESTVSYFCFSSDSSTDDSVKTTIYFTSIKIRDLGNGNFLWVGGPCGFWGGAI